MFAEPLDGSIIWCYKIIQKELLDLQKECPKIQLHEGFNANVYEGLTHQFHDLIVIDDSMTGQ